MHLVFVCSGNICRSPAAEALFLLHAAKLAVPHTATSCGTLRISGEPAAPFTIRALSERGVDLRAHRSRAMSYFLLREADLILCMEPHHRDAVLAELGGDLDLVQFGVRVMTEFHLRDEFRNDAGIYDFVQAEWPEYSAGIDELELCIKGLLALL